MKKNKKKIIFFCPLISDGGIEKTLINYLNYFSINNEISLVTNTFNTKQLKLISKNSGKLKILGFGEIKDKIHIEADLASKSAVEKLEKAGGSIQLKK